jgi:PKD repeat protein
VNTVTLQVSDSAGLTAETKQDITITSLLVASMKIPANSRAIGPAPLNVTFEGNGFRSLSTRNDSNTITKFSWDFGDGTPVLESTEIDQGVQLQEHTYTQPGRYIATLRVEDREGEHAVAAYPVHVGNGQEPIAAIVYSPSFPLDGSIATLFTFDGSASVNALGGEENLDYAWDFGDGSPLLSEPQVTHQYTKVGTYTVTLTITDSQASKIHRTQVQAVVKSIPPQARMVVSPRTGSAPLTVQFDASATEYIGGQITEYSFDYGDGTNALTRTPQSSHIYKQPGTYKVQLKVRASDGTQAKSETAVDYGYTLII